MLELLERPVRTQRPDRLVHARHERVPLLEDEAEVLTARLRPAATRSSPWALPLVALVSVYSGYFGAGAGVLLLASVLLRLTVNAL